MSTVLWANTLINGHVDSDQTDKPALYKHARKLEKITRQLKLTSFLSAQDFTDAQFNLSAEDLPEGMTSTDELMVERGVWITATDAIDMLENLIRYITENDIRFGLIRNDSAAIISELQQSLDYANKTKHGMFNFSVVM